MSGGVWDVVKLDSCLASRSWRVDLSGSVALRNKLRKSTINIIRIMRTKNVRTHSKCLIYSKIVATTRA